MNFELSDVPEALFTEHGVVRGELIPDLSIGGPDRVERGALPEPGVVFPAELKGVSSMAAVELGGKAAVEGTLGLASFGDLRPANPFAGAPQSPDEIPGQLELPFDELPLESGAYTQGAFDLDALQAADGSKQESAASSRDLVSFGEIVDAKIVEGGPKTREEIIAEQRELTREILKSTASEHQRLRELQGRLWGEFAGRLRESAIHNIKTDDIGNYVVEWRMDVHEDEPELAVDRNDQPVGTYVTVAMSSGDMRNIPEEDQQVWQEAWKAMSELHSDGQHGVPVREKKETPLLGIGARKIRGAGYVYSRAALASRLGEVLPEWAAKAKVTLHTVEEDTYHPKEEKIEVEALDEYKTRLPDKLQEVLSRPDSEWTGRIIDFALEGLRSRAQARTYDWKNELAFPDNSNDIKEAMLHKYLLFPTIEAERLDRVNEILASRKLVPRTMEDA